MIASPLGPFGQLNLSRPAATGPATVILPRPQHGFAPPAFAGRSPRALGAEARLRVDSNDLLRIVALCVILASAETLHGILRTLVVTPRIGKELAIKLSAVSGTLLAFGICWLLIPGTGLRSPAAHLALGLGLAAFMAAFDIAMGRFVMRKAWHKIWPDFNPKTGNYLCFGLLALALIPLVIWSFHRAKLPAPT